MLLTASQRPPIIFWSVYHNDPRGPFVIGLTPDGFLCRLSWLERGSPAAALRRWRQEWPRTVFEESKPLQGPLPEKLLLIGTPFQLTVWKKLLTIPPGQPLSYAEMARRIGKPGAARAVGGALRANPIPVLVPCHRVIAASGGLGGFAGSKKPRELSIKRELLESEGFVVR